MSDPKQHAAVLLEAQTAVELAMEGISKLDDAGHYIFVNQHYAALLGYRPEELAGCSWEVTVHPDDRGSMCVALNQMRAVGRAAVEIRGVKKDGSVLYKHVVIVKPDGPSGRMPGYFCFVQDITERKREELLQRAETQAFELVAKGAGLHEVLVFICRTIESHTAPMLCSVMLVSEDGAHLLSAAGPSLPDEYNRMVHGIPIGPTVGSCGSAAYFRKPSVVVDIATDPLWKDYAPAAAAYGLKACWSHPIIGSRGDLLGTFAAYYREPRSPQPTDLAIVERTSHIAALAIEHARMTEALQESEERYRTVVAGMAEGIVIQEQGGRISSCNAAACRILGLTEDQVVGRTSLDPRWQAIHEDGSSFSGDTHPAMETLRTGRACEQVVMGVHRPDGSLVWISINTQPMGAVESDRPSGVVTSFRDITAQKQSEAELRLFRTLLDQVTDSIEVIDPRNGRFLDGNRQSYESIGYTRNELSTLTVPDIDPLVTTDVFQDYMQRLRAVNSPLRIQSLHLRKDGTTFPVEVCAQLLRHDQEYLVAIVRDITDRKTAEEYLQRMRFAMDQAVDAVYWIDPQARILYTNAAAGAMLGYTADEFLRMTVHDLNPDFPAEVWPGFWDETRAKKVISLETVHLTKDGRRIPIDIRVSFLAHGGQEFHCAFVRDISKRKEVEEAAYRSLTLLQSVLHATPIRVFWKDRESCYLGCNLLFALDAGCTDAQQIIGKTDGDLVWHEQAARYRADDRQVMESGCAKLAFDEPGTTPEGKPTWLRTSKVPLRNEQGQVIGVLGVYEDITEQKRIDGALRASQERFELAARASNDGIWDWNILTGQQSWSDRHLELFGLHPGDLSPTYDMWIALVHPDDAEFVHRATRHHLETREPYDIEVRVRMKDGSYRWFRDRGQAVWDASGRPVRMVGSIADVTERRQAEEAIWKAHAQLEQRVVERTKELALANRALEEEIHERKLAEHALRLTQFTVDRAAYGILWVSRNADICYANDAACHLLGYEREELLRMTVHQIDPNFPPTVWAAHWDELKQRGTFTFESSQRTKFGRVHYTEVTVNYLEYEGQEYNCAIVRDITERKLAEEAVRDSELRYKLLSDATFDGIAVHDQGLLLEVNSGLERMYGYEPGELIGRSIMDLVADESREMVIANLRADVRGPYEALGRRKDGSRFPVEVVVRPYRYRGKEVRLMAGRDITARKHLEEERARYLETLEQQVAERSAEITKLESQRAQVEKLAAMGRLVAGVAHEINNPMAGIKNAFTLVRQAVDPAHPHAEFAGLIDREIARVAAIIQNMYQLCRPESRTSETVNLWTLVKDLDILLTPQLQQRRLKFIAEVGQCPNWLCVPRGDLVQVLLNLLTNAIDCSPEGETITLRLQEEAEWIRLTVCDHGEGIEPEHLPRIFDPFYTTKTGRDQKGMGLGLSVSQNLVQAMGGRIEVDTQPGRGSTFIVFLPGHLVGVSKSDQSNIIKEVVSHDR